MITVQLHCNFPHSAQDLRKPNSQASPLRPHSKTLLVLLHPEMRPKNVNEIVAICKMTQISEFLLPGNCPPQICPFIGGPIGHLHGVSGRQSDKTEEINIEKNIKKRYLEVILIIQNKKNDERRRF